MLVEVSKIKRLKENLCKFPKVYWVVPRIPEDYGNEMIIEINPVYLSKGCGTSHRNLSFPNPENSNPEKAEKFAWKQIKNKFAVAWIWVRVEISF